MRREFLKKTTKIGAIAIPTWLLLAIVSSAAIIGVVAWMYTAQINANLTYQESEPPLFYLFDGDGGDDATFSQSGDTVTLEIPVWAHQPEVEYRYLVRISTPNTGKLIFTDVSRSAPGGFEGITNARMDLHYDTSPTNSVVIGSIPITTSPTAMNVSLDPANPNPNTFVNLYVSTGAAPDGAVETMTFKIAKSET